MKGLHTAEGFPQLSGQKGMRGVCVQCLAEQALVRTGRGSSARPELCTYMELERRRLIINTHVEHGTVPGVAVGARFFCREEMAAVGLHRHRVLNDDHLSDVGISSTAAGTCAVSLVVTVGEHRDDGHTLEFPGEGGTSADQQRTEGNLALLDSMQRKLPVRIIREVTDEHMPLGRVFTYDGLYCVQRFTFAPSAAADHQCKRFTFFLNRMPDQTAIFEVLPISKPNTP
jgi:hypothetical protein